MHSLVTRALALSILLASPNLVGTPGWAKERDADISLPTNSATLEADPFTGSLNGGIPIDVPPGRHGMQPNLSLSYSSSNGTGWVGIGWKLEMGSIERSARFGVDYAKNDYVFHMNGTVSDLIELPPAGSNNYRAKIIEGGMVRVEKLPAGGWKVTDPMGIMTFYGQTAASRVADPSNPSKIVKWNLDEVRDPGWELSESVLLEGSERQH
jgi:hypothetical protein